MQGTVLCFYEITWITGPRAWQSGEPVQLIRHRVQSGDGKSDGIIIICIIIMKTENRLSAGLKNCATTSDTVKTKSGCKVLVQLCLLSESHSESIREMFRWPSSSKSKCCRYWSLVVYWYVWPELCWEFRSLSGTFRNKICLFFRCVLS